MEYRNTTVYFVDRIMLSVILLVLIAKTASQDSEPLSEANIFHVWDSGLEGRFYINPPGDIHSWVVHVTLNQPMEVIEVSLSAIDKR